MQTPWRPASLHLLVGPSSALGLAQVVNSKFGTYFVWEESTSVLLWAQEIRDGVLLNKIEIEDKWEFSGWRIHWGK